MNLKFDFPNTPMIPDKIKDKGYYCRDCGSFVKRYTRTFNSNMALALICLYKNKGSGFVHLEKLLAINGYQRCGDASYLRHYGLIEAMDKEREDGSKRNGFYQITDKGIAFVKGGVYVQQNFLIFHNRCEGFRGAHITIREALGKKFNYNELMVNI